jgi:ParB-like chromosome segregation protein Spo0J
MTTKRIIKKILPFAKLFPMHGDAKFAELVASIKQNGLLIPIPRDPNGVLLGGRNRLKACEVAGVEPRFEK